MIGCPMSDRGEHSGTPRFARLFSNGLYWRQIARESRRNPMNDQASANKDAVTRGRSPGWIARFVIAAAVLLSFAAWLAGLLEDPPFPLDDPAVRNLVV